MRQSKRHQAEVDLMVAKMTTPFGKADVTVMLATECEEMPLDPYLAT